MGIVQVATNLLPGGVASQIFYLLSGLDRRKWSPVVVALTPGDENAAPFREHEIPVVTLGITHVSGVVTLYRSVRGIARVARDVRAAVIHTHFDRASYYGRVAARLLRVPVAVHTFHGIESVGPPRMKRERRLRSITDRYIAVSESTRRHMAGEGFDDSKFVVVHSGVPEDAFYPDERDRAAVRKELGVSDDVVLVGSVSRLDPDKNVGNLVESAKVALDLCPRLRFAVAGGGSQESELRRKIDDLGMADRFHLLGHRSDVPRLLRGLDMFVLASPSEGMPLALIEAMMSGVAAAGTPVGGVPDVVAGGAGLVTASTAPADVADSIARLATDHDLRARIASQGRARALSEFSRSAFVGRMEALYRDIMKSKGCIFDSEADSA